MNASRSILTLSLIASILCGCHTVPTDVSVGEIEAAEMRDARSGFGDGKVAAARPTRQDASRIPDSRERPLARRSEKQPEREGTVRLASHVAEGDMTKSSDLPPLPTYPSGADAAAPALRVPQDEFHDPGATLEHFEGLALHNNPAISEAQARVAALRGKWVQVGLSPNPTAGYAASEVGNEDHSGQVGGYFSQELVTGGKLQLNRAVVSQEIRRSQQVLAAQRQRVITDVRIRYYEVLVAQRRLELTRSLLQTTSRAAESVEKLLAAKESTRPDLLLAQVEADNARLLVQNAESIHAAAWQKLAIIVGCPGMPPQNLTGDLEATPSPVEWESVRHRILGASPQLAAAIAEVDRSRWAVKQARAQVIPNVDLQSTFQKDNATGYNISGFQITLPVPILNYNQGGIRQAESEMIAARRAVTRVELSLEQKLAQTYQRYSVAQQQAEQYSLQILPKVRETLTLVNEGYRGGEVSFLQLLTSQRTYVQTNLTYLDSLMELWTAYFEIDGLLLRDSLDQSSATE